MIVTRSDASTAGPQVIRADAAHWPARALTERRTVVQGQVSAS
jgi:hypothetical protein